MKRLQKFLFLVAVIWMTLASAANAAGPQADVPKPRGNRDEWRVKEVHLPLVSIYHKEVPPLPEGYYILFTCKPSCSWPDFKWPFDGDLRWYGVKAGDRGHLHPLPPRYEKDFNVWSITFRPTPR